MENKIKSSGLSRTSLYILFITLIVTMLILLSSPIPHRASDKALSISCEANLRKIYEALISYSCDHNDWYPPDENGLELLVQLGYLNQESLKCPLFNVQGGRYFYSSKERRKGTDYIYVPGHRYQVDPVAICYDKAKNHYGKNIKNTINVLYTDSYVASYDESSWKQRVIEYEKGNNPR